LTRGGCARPRTLPRTSAKPRASADRSAKPRRDHWNTRSPPQFTADTFWRTPLSGRSLVDLPNGGTSQAPGHVLSVPSQLTSVTAISAADAWAVGSYGNSSTVHTLIEHWNGRAWHRMPSPSPGNIAALFGAASSRASLWAVGYYNSGGPAQTLAVHCC